MTQTEAALRQAVRLRELGQAGSSVLYLGRTITLYRGEPGPKERQVLNECRLIEAHAGVRL